MSTKSCVVYVTAPQASVRRIVETVLKSRTAACVNVIATVKSTYWWQGKIERGTESLLIMKTTVPRLKALERVVKKAHPYTVPEIIALPILFGSAAYLSWLKKETR